MAEQPDAAALLKIARQTLLEKLLPELPASSKYDALMVANAVAIATREIGTGEAGRRAELELLTALYPDEATKTETVVKRLQALNDRLAKEIRQGRCNAERASEIHAVLLAQARRRLAVSNPKYLARSDAG